LLVAWIGCGEPEGKPSDTGPPKVSPEIQGRIESLESQLAQLEQFTHNVRREVESIEATREALAAQLDNLKRDLGAGRRPDAQTGAEEQPSSHAAEGSPARDETEGGGLSFIFKLLIFVIIIIAVFSIGRIFFHRWNLDGAEHPIVERTNELGTVRYPGSAAPASESSPVQTTEGGVGEKDQGQSPLTKDTGD
jgi:hypothetical protein